MLPTHDTSDVPEARTMTVFLGYLFARLIESSSQIRAAIKIEKYFLLYRWRSARSQSAKIIQRKFASYVQRRKYIYMIEEWREYKSCCETTHSEENCHEKNDNEGNINNNTACYQVYENMNVNATESEKVDNESEDDDIDEDEDACNDDLWLIVGGSNYMCGHNVGDEKLYEQAERDRITELLHRTTNQHSEQCPAVDVKAVSAYSPVTSYPDALDSSRLSYPDIAEYFDKNNYVHTLQEGEDEYVAEEKNEILANKRQSIGLKRVQERGKRSSPYSRNADDKFVNRNDSEEHPVPVPITMCHTVNGQSVEELKTEIDSKPYDGPTNCENSSSRGFSKLQVRAKKHNHDFCFDLSATLTC